MDYKELDKTYSKFTRYLMLDKRRRRFDKRFDKLAVERRRHYTERLSLIWDEMTEEERKKTTDTINELECIFEVKDAIQVP